MAAQECFHTPETCHFVNEIRVPLGHLLGRVGDAKKGTGS